MAIFAKIIQSGPQAGQASKCNLFSKRFFCFLGFFFKLSNNGLPLKILGFFFTEKVAATVHVSFQRRCLEWEVNGFT